MAIGGEQCPGQSTMFWRPEDVHEKLCPHCGYSIEFFKIDLKRTCPRCRREVLNPKANFSCAEWCKHAEECLGPTLYSQVAEKRDIDHRRQEDIERLMTMILPEDDAVKDIFMKLYRENTDPVNLIDTRSLGLLHETNPTLADRAMKYYREFAEQRK